MLLEVKNLSFGFPQKPLISDLSFQISKSCFIAVIGHNGSGKSTFLKSLLCKHDYKGEIFLHGQNNRSFNLVSRSGYISCLEQRNIFSFDMKVIDLAIMGRFRFKKFFSEYDKEDKQIAIEVLKDLGIDHLREKDFLSLSGGEQQLVWLAQLLVQDTDISLLDEPTQQLDLYNKKKIFYQMQKWVAEKGKTVICVTHDIMNLYNMQGYFLNFSENKPALKELNRSNLDESIKELLDEKKAWDPEDLI